MATAQGFDQTPSNAVTLAGEPTLLNCTISHVDTAFQWFHYYEHSNPGDTVEIFYAGDPYDEAKYMIDGKYNLIIKMTNLSSAGTYACKTRFQSANRRRFAAVHVLGESWLIVPTEIFIL